MMNAQRTLTGSFFEIVNQLRVPELRAASRVFKRIMKDFKKLKVWQKGMQVVTSVYELAVQLPSDEKFGLRSQLTRAAVSVPSNIAEGSAKQSKKEYVRFLEMALGSLFELETQILIVDRLGYGSKQLRMSLLEDIDQEQKMLMSFIRKVGE